MTWKARYMTRVGIKVAIFLSFVSEAYGDHLFGLTLERFEMIGYVNPV